MNKRWDIFGVGTSAVDDLLYVDRFPQPDEKMPVKAKHRQGGGQTATALVAASRQGARTAYCGQLGEDELSQYTIAELEREGVDCTPVIHTPGCKPYHAVVIVDAASGSRTILYHSEGVREPDVKDIAPEWIEASRMVFIDQNSPRAGLRAAQLAKAAHIPVVADLEKTSMPDLALLLAHIDHLIVNTEFARQFSGKAAVTEMVRALACPERTSCVVTGGSQGCWYAEHGGEVQHFPAFSVQVIDTTGCGDVFHGAYAAAVARGESVRRAVTVASATAAIKAAHPGGRSGIPDLTAVEQFLHEHAAAD